jgi:protein-L-isoaspartate O-methyltransferase
VSVYTHKTATYTRRGGGCVVFVTFVTPLPDTGSQRRCTKSRSAERCFMRKQLALFLVLCAGAHSFVSPPPSLARSRRACPRRHTVTMSATPSTGLNRVAQHNKPYTSIDAAIDTDVIGVGEIDPYVGTALGTAREFYCAAHSDVPANVAAALEFVEQETNRCLSKQYMLTGALAASTLAMMVRMAGATNVLEIGAYTGYSTIALGSTGAAVTTIDSFEDEAESEAVFHAGVAKSGLPIKLLKMKALDALQRLIESPPVRPFDFVFIDADKTEQLAYFELLMGNSQLWGSGEGRTCTMVVDNTLWYVVLTCYDVAQYSRIVCLSYAVILFVVCCDVHALIPQVFACYAQSW